MNMRRYLGVMLVLGSMLACQCRAVMAQVDTELDAARAANAAARAGINSTVTPSIVPGYTESPPETSLYGQPDLRTQAQARLATCRSRPDDPVCEGQVKAFDSAGTPREPVLPTDPAIAGAENVALNPFQVEGNLASWYSGCAPDGTCAASRFCIGTRCFDLTSTQDPNFAEVMSYLEAGREAGVYLDPNTIKVFAGEGNWCRHRLLTNCCKSDSAGRGFTNQSIFGVGSRLVYDILMKSGNRQFVVQGFRALLMGSGFSGAFSTYGVTVAVNGAALPAGSISIYSSQSIVIGFDPWSLAIAVIFYVVMSMMQCDEEEGKLAMKEGARLCRSIGSWCSHRVLGVCLTRKTGKCCFNSRLARMINEQGRAQFGMGWGTPRAPDCSGFTVSQLQAMDFSRMDLTEFYAEIVPTLPDLAAIQGRVGQRAVNCYQGGGRCY